MKWRVFVLGLGVLLLAAGCAHPVFPTPTPRPTSTPRLVATNTVAAPTPTAVQVHYVGELPGDPVEGERLFHTFQPSAGTMCMACHRTDSDDRLVGPGLKTVGIRAQTRVAGQSASQYLYTSIIDPAAYVVDGYPNLMPKNWGRVFTEAQVADLIAYLIRLSS